MGSITKFNRYLFAVRKQMLDTCINDMHSTGHCKCTSRESWHHFLKLLYSTYAFYGCEMWGTFRSRMYKKKTNIYMIPLKPGKWKTYIKFCKYHLRSWKKSTNISIISEWGRYSLYSLLVQSILLYWHRLKLCGESSLQRNH